MSAGRDPEVTYDLGVDLGTTYSSIALIRGLRAEMIVLGHRSPLVPSAVWLGPDGEILVGDAALRRGQREPEGLVREFKRRLGDPVPLIVRGSPVSAAQLTTMLMASIMDQVVLLGRPTTEGGSHSSRQLGAVPHDIFREAVRPMLPSDPLSGPKQRRSTTPRRAASPTADRHRTTSAAVRSTLHPATSG